MAPNDNDDKLMPDQVAPNLSELLCARRASLGWTLDRMANRTGGAVEVADLERFEAGALDDLDRFTMHALARAYDLDVALLFVPHEPVRLDDGVLRAGDVAVVPYSDHLDDVLVAYLELLRTLRGDPEAPVLSFRRIDVDAIATATNYPGEAIIGRLAILIGARGLRQAAMAGSYSSGVEIITTGKADERPPPADDGPWGDHATIGPLGRSLGGSDG